MKSVEEHLVWMSEDDNDIDSTGYFFAESVK